MTIKIELDPLQVLDILHELKTNAYLYLKAGYLGDNVKCSQLANCIEVQYNRQQPTENPQHNDHHF